MKMAKPGQRIMACLIDTFILFAFVTIISTLINMACKLTPPETVSLPNDELKEVIKDRLSSNETLKQYGISITDENISSYVLLYKESEWVDYLSENSKESLSYELSQYYSACVNYEEKYDDYTYKTGTIAIGVFLFLVVIYYNVIGYYWSKQTVGRYIMKIKVVDRSFNRASFSRSLLRDFIGFGVLNVLNAILMLAPLIINAVLLFGKDGLTIGDRISKTVMIRLDEPEEEKKVEENDSPDDVIDAEVVEDVTNEE